jgi:hypothetical protein
MPNRKDSGIKELSIIHDGSVREFCASCCCNSELFHVGGCGPIELETTAGHQLRDQQVKQ